MKRFTVLLAFFAMLGMTLQAQNVQITGSVTSAEDGSALPGVSVVVSGTTLGTVTDFNGDYVLSVPQTATTLVFSFVGMKTTEVAIEGRTTIDIALEADALNLDEVVVTAIGIKREAKALGFSVTEVDEEQIARSQTTDIVNSLTGKVAGVRINQSSGAAGASTFMTIRGASSLTGNNQPLFVVDGVPVLSGGGGYGVDGVATSKRTIDINPEDVESISVLKGGAATALYGVRAANGVVIVTTKRGQSSNKVNVNVHSAVTVSQISQVPDLNDKYAQGFGTWGEGSSLSWGPLMDTLYYYRPPEWENATYQWNPDGWLVGRNEAGIDPAYLTDEKAKVFDRYEFFQTGVSYNNNVSLSGGNDATTYYFSLGNITEEGVIPNNTFSRTSIKLSLDSKISTRLSMGGSVNYVNSGGDRIQQGSNISGVMLGLLRTPPSFNNAAGYKFPDGTQRNYRGSGTSPGAYDNPYWTANENLYRDNTNRFIGNYNLNWNATDWMTLTWRIGTDFYTDEFKDYFAIGSRNQPTGSNQDYMSYVQNTNSDLLLNFRKDFGSMIKTSLTLGQNMYNYSFKSVSGTANGLEIPNFYEVNNTANQTTFSTVTKYRTAALFGELAVQYGDMLFLTGTLRNDWSTTMPDDNLSDLYPSGSLGFVFTEIPGLKGNTVLPFGKLRVSYASIANIAGAENTLTYFVAGGASDGWVSPNGLNFPLLGFSGFTLSNGLGNSDLQHEAQNSFEVGVDLRFFNNRFSVDFAYFNNQNEDLLLSVPIAASTGYTSLYQNAGSMESVGFEILSNIVPVQTPNFRWDLTVNFNKYTNTVLQLAPGVDNLFLGGFVDPQIRAVEGEEYPTIYGYDYWRDDNGNLVINDNPDDAYPDGFPMGNYVLVPMGQVNPDWVMGITNTFSLFKSLSISALLEIKEGGSMWNGTRGALRYFGAHADTESRDDPTFVFDGVKGYIDINEDGEEVVVTSGEPNDQEVTKDVSWYALGEGSGFTGATMEIEETSWVRLRELTVSYNLPPSILNNTFLDKVEIYFTGRNLFLSTPYEGIDPETNLLGSSNAQGMDYFNMPGTKSYSFGLRLGF